MVEFALILFPFLLLVVGVIQFGIALNFWHDQQRLAAQGARVAIVDCAAATWCTPTLEEFLEAQPLSNGNRPTAEVCYVEPSGAAGTKPLRGDYVRVTLSSPFRLVPIVGIGTLTLKATSEMRLEQTPTHSGIKDEPPC
jgi:hypothetical protein